MAVERAARHGNGACCAALRHAARVLAAPAIPASGRVRSRPVAPCTAAC